MCADILPQVVKLATLRTRKLDTIKAIGIEFAVPSPHPEHCSSPQRLQGEPNLRLLACAMSLLLLSAAPPQTVESFEGKVVALADGDTITVLRDGTQVKIRLEGIDAPEKNQAFGNKAKVALSDHQTNPESLAGEA